MANITIDNLPTLSSILGTEFIVVDNGVTTHKIALSDLPKADINHTHGASDITSGTFADGRISQSSVTQHQSSLSLTASQVSDFDDAVKNSSGAGWGYYVDTAHTVLTPLVVNNARVRLTNNGLGVTSETTYEPAGLNLWDTTNNEINMGAIGDAFQVRIDWKAKTTTAGAFYALELDIGGGGTIPIVRKVIQTNNGINVEERFSETISGFALATFLANGCKIYFDSTEDSANISIYDIGLKIERTYND